MAPPQPRSDVPTLGTLCSHPWQLHSPSEQLLGKVPIEGSHLCHQSPPSQFGTGNTPSEQLSTHGTPPRHHCSDLITQGQRKAFPSSLRAAVPLWGTHSSWLPSPAVTKQWWQCPACPCPAPCPLLLLQGGTARNTPHSSSPAPPRVWVSTQSLQKFWEKLMGP